MKLYKVIFFKNKAVAASPFSPGLLPFRSVEVGRVNNKRIIKAITFFAENEREGINFANGVVRSFAWLLRRSVK